MVRVEGFDFDQTMAGLQAYMGTGASSVTLVLKRLVKRETLKVQQRKERAGAGRPTTHHLSRPVCSRMCMCAYRCRSSTRRRRRRRSGA